MQKKFSVEEPVDLIKNNLNEIIYVKCRGAREMRGRLIAFDEHLNMILQEVEEIYKENVTDEKGQKSIKQYKRNFPMLYMRGDTVVLLAPVAGIV